MNAIEVLNVSKKFVRPPSHIDNFFARLLQSAHKDDNFAWALKNICFEVPQGTTLGIIGKNGSGKSTLLSILAGILQPTKGEYVVKGTLSAILELGSGFHPEFTGRENIYTYGSIMGLSKREINARLPDILDFSELSAVVDKPLFTYSSGMIARLAFAVAMNSNAQVFLIDEVLAVGDALFQHRCIRKIQEMQARGATIVYVSHDTDSMRSICSSAILLQGGSIVAQGDPTIVVNAYHAFLTAEKHAQSTNLFHGFSSSVSLLKSSEKRYGDNRARITKVETVDMQGKEKNVFSTCEQGIIRIHIQVNEDIEKGFNVGYIIRNAHADIYGTNTYWLGEDLGEKKAGDVCAVDFIQKFSLGSGIYSLSVAIAQSFSRDDFVLCDWINECCYFRIEYDSTCMGYVNMRSRIGGMTGSPMKQKYMEDNLDMPLGRVLSIMQNRKMQKTTYFGVQAIKNPIDHWIYQEMIYELRPEVIIEIGNAYGGGLLSLAHLCDLLGGGRVIGIDITHASLSHRVREHPRITLIEGDAVACYRAVARLIGNGKRVLIIEDSSHTYENTLDILRTYQALLSIGDYFIIEDGICHHGLDVGPAPGPYEAIETFVRENPMFEIDRNRESFFITWNPKGYVRKKLL